MSFFESAKNFIKDAMVEAAAEERLLAIPTYHFRTKNKTAEAKMMFDQYLRITKDSAKLVNTTTNPDVFFSRFDLLVENLRLLASLESYVKYSGERPKNVLKRVLTDRDKETETFIIRAYDKLVEDIDKLKTQKAKENRIEKHFSKILEYSDVLSASNTQLLRQLRCRIDLQIKP